MASLNDPTGLPGQSRASYINMLKIQYASMWDAHVHKASKIMEKLAKKGGSMGGQETKAVVVTNWPQSTGVSLREGVHLPTARVGTYINPTLRARDIYTSLLWSGNAERSAAAGKQVAWAQPRTQDLEDARKQFDIEMTIKTILGFFEARGQIASYDGGTDIATLQGRNARTASGEEFWRSGASYLRVNRAVGFAAAPSGAPTYNQEVFSGTTNTNEIYVTAIGGTNAAPTVTMSAAPSSDPSAADHIIPFASRANTGNPPWTGTAADEITAYASFNGLFTAASDSTIYAAIYGLAKSSNTTLGGKYLTGSSAGTTRPFEERLVHLLVDRIRDEGTGNEPDFLYLHSATRREVVAEHADDRRYAPVLGASGYGKLVAHVGDSALPYTSDWLMLPGLVAAVNSDCWNWITEADMSPLEKERFVPSYDQHEIIWHKSGNIECRRPFDQGMLDDIDFDVFDINV